MTVNFREHIGEQIKHRYVEAGTKYVRNIDLSSTYIPYGMVERNRYNLYNKRVISPNLLQIGKEMMDNGPSNCINFNSLCSMAELNWDDISHNINLIKDKNIDLISIGYGGFSINVIHFMYLIGKDLGQQEWLNSLTIYENDNISLTNSFRIYKDMSQFLQTTPEPTGKLDLLGDDTRIAKEIIKKPVRFNNQRNVRNSNSIFFGAPDFVTRKKLENSPFIFTGHSGNEVEFYSRPIVDSDLTRETYGKIDIDYFFINILKSAEKLIEILATTNVNSFPADTKLFQYNAELRNKELS